MVKYALESDLSEEDTVRDHQEGKGKATLGQGKSGKAKVGHRTTE
jgi:hypothetical protein